MSFLNYVKARVNEKSPDATNFFSVESEINRMKFVYEQVDDEEIEVEDSFDDDTDDDVEEDDEDDEEKVSKATTALQDIIEDDDLDVDDENDDFEEEVD